MAVVGLTCGCLFYSHAQVAGAADSMRVQATRMANGLVTGNYTVFIRYIHPRILEISGGADQLKAYLKQASDMMGQQGMKFQSVTVDTQVPFIHQGSQLQATLQQHTTIKLRQGRVVATSTLIGTSVDNGAHWHFIDSNNKTLDDLRKILPNLSTALVIPPPQQPVHYDN